MTSVVVSADISPAGPSVSFKEPNPHRSSGTIGRHSSGLSSYHSTDLIFVGKGNPQPAKYIIIPKSQEEPRNLTDFAEHFLLRGLDKAVVSEEDVNEGNFLPSKPNVLISVTGGAQDFYMHSSKLEQVFNRGLLKAAQTISAWIIDGGLDAGVMQYVGKAVKEMAVDDVPCIGIASHKKVILHNLLKEDSMHPGMTAEYVANQPNNPLQCALNPNHTHFILVDSPEDKWGEEIKFRSELESCIREKFHIPVVLIVVNGGPGTLETVAQGAEKKFAVVVVQGSGRASDAIAAVIKKARHTRPPPQGQHLTWEYLAQHRDESVDLLPWDRLLADARRDEDRARLVSFMNRILANIDTITLFSADDEADADMDIFILRAILKSQIADRKMTLNEKLKLGVLWDRVDIVREILDTDYEVGDGKNTGGDQRRGLNEALMQALLLDRAEIFTVLADKGAQKESVDLNLLYFHKPLIEKFRRIPAYSAEYARYKSTLEPKTGSMNSSHGEAEKEEETLEFAKAAHVGRNVLKELFRDCGNAFNGYQQNMDRRFDAQSEMLADTAERDYGEIKQRAKHAKRRRGTVTERSVTYSDDSKVSFTDFLIWAILLNRLELAKAVWRKTTLPVHTALVSVQLYKYLADQTQDDDDCEEGAKWFEAEAIKLLDRLEFTDVRDVLTWEWALMGYKTALDIAGDAECKEFVAHGHVQALLDEMFYSDKYGSIEPTTPFYQMWATILIPFPLIYWLHSPKEGDHYNPFMFYHIPIVKFWTNSLFYCAFLFVQAWVICTLTAGDSFRITEIVLWIWVVALIVEECVQFYRDPSGHFAHLSNQLDILLLLLHVVYMILRWVSYAIDGSTSQTYSAAINTLIVACVFSWCRLLNVFAIDPSLGPLYFTIVKLFRDIFYWLFVFIIFAVSFQIGFVNITIQAGSDPTSGYPRGSLPVSFFTIIGDFNYIDPVMKQAPIGIAMLGVYAMIAQIMLVNLLIAMMGSTYSNVFDNSTGEWKFYRLEMVVETQAASFHPPPTNLVVYPIEVLIEKIVSLRHTGIHKVDDNTTVDNILLPEPPAGSDDTPQLAYPPLHQADSSGLHIQTTEHPSMQTMRNTEDPELRANLERTVKKMRAARDEVVAKEIEEEENSVVSICRELQKKLRTLMNERENDRTFTEKRFKDLEINLRGGGSGSLTSSQTGGVGAAVADLTHQMAELDHQNKQILQILAQQQQMMSHHFGRG